MEKYKRYYSYKYKILIRDSKTARIYYKRFRQKTKNKMQYKRYGSNIKFKG